MDETPEANQKRLLSLLGPEYSLKVIDLELCVYRRINATYDIEISGTSYKGRKIGVYVWRDCVEIVDRVCDIKTDYELITTLNSFVKKYSG